VNIRTTLAIAAAVGALCAGTGVRAGESSGGGAVLSGESRWRVHRTWRTPQIRRDGELVTAGDGGGSYLSSWECHSPPPPEGWPAADFDDSAWGRTDVSSHARVVYGFSGAGPGLAVECLRARFRVADPSAVRGLKLSLGYRGGAAVYVNGTEVARANLPAGELTAETFAEDLPVEAFEVAKGKCVMSHAVHGGGKVLRNAENLAARVRRIEDLAIDHKLLRAGVNVLAVRVHRAPYYGIGLRKEGLNHRSAWATCGLAGLTLAADAGVEPNVSRPAGVRVWTASTLSRVSPESWADPTDPLRPIRIVAARNGRFTGQVVVSSAGKLGAVRASVSDLQHAAGKGAIPAGAVKVLYALPRSEKGTRYRGKYFDPLASEPPVAREWALQPVWIKVSVPADAAPGEYAGKLTLGGAAAAEVPVKLRVIDWKLPDPVEYVTHMGVIQSPDSVALQYKVPMWSEDHWKLMEKSFAYLGEIGNKVVVVPMLCQTNFGHSQTMVRWVKNGSGYKHDFAVFDRYMDLALKYTRPDVIWLYAWDRYAGQSRWAGKGDTEGRGIVVTQLDPATGKGSELVGPRMGTPECKAFLGPAYRGVRERLEKRGLLGITMMGTNGDAYWPRKDISEMLKELMPGAKWINSSHPDTRGRDINGIPIGYNTCVYINLFPAPGRAKRGATDGHYYGWQAKSDIFPRSGGPATRQPLHQNQVFGVHRITVEAAFLANCSGLGRTGADFWPVLAPPKKRTTGKRSESIVGSYVETCWNQLNMNTATEFLLAPGPEGATSTARFEAVREGVQECEARIFVEKALLAGKLDAALAKKCRAVLDERAWMIRSGCLNGSWEWYEEQAPTLLAEKLFECAAELAAKTGK
jgi:hypothetical protein